MERLNKPILTHPLSHQTADFLQVVEPNYSHTHTTVGRTLRPTEPIKVQQRSENESELEIINPVEDDKYDDLSQSSRIVPGGWHSDTNARPFPAPIQLQYKFPFMPGILSIGHQPPSQQRFLHPSGLLFPHYAYPHHLQPKHVFPTWAQGPHPPASMSIMPVVPTKVVQEEVVISDKPKVFYRNLFHTIVAKFSRDAKLWEGCRVYINDSVGYSGNAKRFKRRPEKDERALLLECAVFDPKGQLISETCLACKDYFETQKYFKTNQECIGKMMLVKNNAPISVENGEFRILVKMMCCCQHHSLDHFSFVLSLSSVDDTISYTSKVDLNVKQWRKSNQKKEECTVYIE